MKGLRHCAVALAALFVACGREAPDTSCPECSIEMRLLTTIGGTGDSGSFPVWPRLSRDEQGRFYGVTPDRAGVPFVFDSAGHFLQALGGTGHGPGEFAWPRAVLPGAADSIYVLDIRLTVLTGSYDVARTEMLHGFAAAYDAALAFGGRLVLDVPGARDIPIHVLDQMGVPIAHFGDPDSHCPHCEMPVYVLGVARDGTLWTARRFYEYRIDRWDATGTRLAGAVIEAPWFAPYDSLRSPAPDQPPPAWVSGVWEDERGRVWILGRTADPRWQRGLGEPRTVEGGTRYYPIVDRAAALDGIIEVIDPTGWKVIARRRLDDDTWLTPVAPGMIASLRETPDGWWLADVYRVTLVGGP